MDRVILRKVAKSGRLNDRYILKECLFSNELGQLNYASDTRHSAGMAAGADVLIHLFPDWVISPSQLVNDFNRLQKTIKASPCPVLPILDYGWVGNSAYFVMVAPESWSVKVLPNLQGQPSTIHCDAIKLTSKLLKEQLVSKGLVPQAFLVTPVGLKVLGTVLTEQFQKIQMEMTLLPSSPDHEKDHQTKSVALSFSVLVGIAVAGGTYFYQQPEQLTKESAINAPEIRSGLTSAILANNPVTTKTTTIALMEDLPNSFPVNEFPGKDLQANNKGHITAASYGKRLGTQITFAATTPDQSETAGEKFNQQTTSPNQNIKTDGEKLAADGLNHQQLIERAYTAIKEGNLSEQPGAGSIYYIRLLKRTSPAHPQVRQLAREVVSAYRIKAQTLVKLKQAQKASQHLWVAGRIIKEFSLNKINRPHLVLKQQLAE